MSQSKRGLFITFEGGEGAGKTTLIEAIAETLISRGFPLLKTREPGGTSLGESIRHLLLDTTDQQISPYAEFSLFLASRAQHLFEVIRPALSLKKIVLCDRFNDSSIAYQGVARGLGKKLVGSVCDFMSEGMKPDLTLYLDIDPEVGLRRAKKRHSQDRIESESLAFHTKIREAYLSIHQEEPHRFHLLDASKSPLEVYEKAFQLIEKLL